MALAAALVVAVLWIEPTATCTDLGCDDRVHYSIPDAAYIAWGATPDVPVIVQTCVDDMCRVVGVVVDEEGESRGLGGEVRLEAGTLDIGETHTVSLKVTDSSRAIRYARSDSGVTLTKFQPNGPDCRPTCAAWTLALEPEELGL